MMGGQRGAGDVVAGAVAGINRHGFGADGGFWLPGAASGNAQSVDGLFNFILWLCIFFFVGIVALQVLFVVRFRARKDGDEATDQTTHNTPLELAWSLIPLGLVIVIFWWGFKSYIDLVTPPGNSYAVQVTAQKWNWLFTYPNGYADGELHCTVDQPVKLTMASQDVLHSFYVPAFRVKQDVVPGRYTTLWFRPTKVGEYQVFCTEYCGKGHSDMLSRVIVHTAADFQAWMDKAANYLDALPPAEGGALVYKKFGCKQCHSADGAPGTGPTFKGLFGTDQTLKGGGTARVDENFIRESVLEPQAKVAAGFEPVMPTFQGRLNDKEIGALIEYLRTLK